MAKIIPNPKFKEFVEDYVSHLREALNLHNFTIHINYVSKISAHRFSPEKQGASAEVEQDPVYMDITISISKKMQESFLTGGITEVMYDLCHEMAHNLLEEYWSFALKRIREDEQEELVKVNERQTQLITMVLMKHIKINKIK